jgi:hypothetical protein
MESSRRREHSEMSLARGEGRQTRNLAEVVKDALEDEGGGDDDGAYGGHGPRRRLVQRPRAVPGGASAAHCCLIFPALVAR